MTERTSPFMKYIGGKRWLAKRIIEMLPPHTCYVEPFGGMGAVLLAKQRSTVEVWNDIDIELANVMRQVRYHPNALAEEIQWMFLHRKERKHWLKYPGETEIQRAARWIVVRRSSYQGCANRGFYVSKLSSFMSNDVLIDKIRAVSRRLSGVVIECLQWQRIFDMYDSPETVFYCDPPYADGDQNVYEYRFSEADHRELADRLRGIKGQWILTYGDHPLIRNLYADCHIEEVRRMRMLNQKTRREYVELIITP